MLIFKFRITVKLSSIFDNIMLCTQIIYNIIQASNTLIVHSLMTNALIAINCMCLLYRWVKWTWLVQYWDHSLTSSGLGTCHWTAKVTWWLLTLAMPTFCCWTVNWNCNASSLTSTPKSSCGGQSDFAIMSCCLNCTFFASVCGLKPSQCTTCADPVSQNFQ